MRTGARASRADGRPLASASAFISFLPARERGAEQSEAGLDAAVDDAALDGGWLYLVGRGGAWLFNVALPARPVRVAERAAPSETMAIAVGDGRVYMAASFEGLLELRTPPEAAPAPTDGPTPTATATPTETSPPTPRPDFEVTGLVYDVDRGRSAPIAGARLFVTGPGYNCPPYLGSAAAPDAGRGVASTGPKHFRVSLALTVDIWPPARHAPRITDDRHLQHGEERRRGQRGPGSHTEAAPPPAHLIKPREAAIIPPSALLVISRGNAY